MLEIVIAPLEARKTAFVYHGSGSTTKKKGTFYVLSGTFAAADITGLPAGQKNKPGYASAGDLKLVPAYGKAEQAFPAFRHEFQVENDDDTLDVLNNGQQVTYFEQGEFRTTEFTDLDNSPVFGNYLKTSASGTLTEESTLTTQTTSSVAQVINLFTSHSAAKKHRLHFKLINSGSA